MCETNIRVDVRQLARRGGLAPGQQGEMSFMGASRIGSVRFEAFPYVLRLYYDTPGRDGQWDHVLECVELDHVPQPLGGKRAWFKCPRCGDRCAILYLRDRFACRKCNRLAYRSQRMDPSERALAQAGKIRRKLGGSGRLDESFPSRPAGMHQSTFLELIERYEACLERAENWPIEAAYQKLLRGKQPLSAS
jgi:hypothetical protein